MMQYETSENEIYEKMSTENLARVREIEEINSKLRAVKEEVYQTFEKEKEELRVKLEKDNNEFYIQMDENKKNLQNEIDENYSTNTNRINELADNLAVMFKSALVKMSDENADRIQEIEGLLIIVSDTYLHFVRISFFTLC